MTRSTNRFSWRDVAGVSAASSIRDGGGDGELEAELEAELLASADPASSSDCGGDAGRRALRHLDDVADRNRATLCVHHDSCLVRVQPPHEVL